MIATFHEAIKIALAINKNIPYSVNARMVRADGSEWIMHAQGRFYRDKKDRLAKFVGIQQDVTEASRAEQEKEKLIQELQRVLSEIKTLQGIVPICAYCKEIRDDKGFWDAVEAYIEMHTEAEFSHGICPKCAAKHFPDFSDNKKA